MADRFKNKAVLVTGAGAGIGRATAAAFAAEGARVVVADRAAGEGKATAKLIADGGGQAVFLKVDVADSQQVRDLIAKAVEHFGRLDVAVNNAGIQGEYAPTAEYTDTTWERTIGVNLTGVFLCMKHELTQMKKQGGGAIVNTASILGLVGGRGNCAYVASKHGVVGLTKAAALEYAPDKIRVNAVCPGGVDTPMMERAVRFAPDETGRHIREIPLGRLASPDEIAQAVLYLASDAAAMVTGQTLVIDGGWLAQ